jgi:two-component system phosphate regulon sensor histidine kinase PhoR
VADEGATLVTMLRSPLFRRLFGAVALLPLIATAAGAALLVRGEARDALAERLRSDAILVRESAAPLLRAHDGAALDRIAKQLAAEVSVRLTFIDGDGVVLGDSDHDPATMENHALRPEVLAARETGAGRSLRWSQTIEKEMLYVALRADPAEPALGVVRASLPVATLEARLRALYLRVALLATPFGLAALATAAISLGVFSRAVHDLTGAAEAVAAGGPARRTEAEERADEIGSLARAVRGMADELSRRLAALGRERTQLAAVVGGLDEGLVAVARDLTVLLANEAAVRLLDLGAAPESGRALVDTVGRPAVAEVARDALEGRSGAARTLEVIRGTGEPRIVEVRATPFGEGGVDGVVLLFRDVTEVERYERLRREFVANVSHELRTPVALVKGYLETLEDGALRDPERGPRFLAILRRHVDGLARLVADLLTLSELESRAETRPAEPVDIAAAVDAVLVPFEAEVARKRLRVVRRLPAGLPPVAAHRERVERAIRNLVDNAVKFSPEGGAIEISARARGGEVALDVRDDGPGVPPEDAARIFERFYRVEKSRSREAGGTGLGLAIVKHIMQQAGGAVAVRSEPGRGATFTLTFPVHEAG